MFVDDICLILEIDGKAKTAKKMNTDLSLISNWAWQWLAPFSSPKTKSLIISIKLDSHLNLTFYSNDIPIEEDFLSMPY